MPTVNATPQSINRFSDMAISFQPHPITGDILMVTGIQDVVQSMMNLVQLNKYDVPYHSEISSGVRGLLFENADTLTAGQLETEITNVIKNFEPRAQLLSVLVSATNDGNGYDVEITALILNNTNPITISTFLERLR